MLLSSKLNDFTTLRRGPHANYANMANFAKRCISQITVEQKPFTTEPRRRGDSPLFFSVVSCLRGSKMFNPLLTIINLAKRFENSPLRFLRDMRVQKVLVLEKTVKEFPTIAVLSAIQRYNNSHNEEDYKNSTL
jgi:hypothetical protein